MQQVTIDETVWAALLVAYHKLKSARPDDRSEHSRRYAVTITEFEKVISYFNTMVLGGFEG